MYLINLKKKSLIFVLISLLMILLAIILTILIYFITKTTTDIYYIENWENYTPNNNDFLKFKIINHNNEESTNNNNNNINTINYNTDNKDRILKMTGKSGIGGTVTIGGNSEYLDNNDNDSDGDDDDTIYIDGDNENNSIKNNKVKVKDINSNLRNDNYFDNSGSGDYNLINNKNNVNDNSNNNFYSVSSEFISNLRKNLKSTTPRTTVINKNNPSTYGLPTLNENMGSGVGIGNGGIAGGGGGGGYGLNLKINRKQQEYDDNLTEKFQINNFKKRERNREDSSVGDSDAVDKDAWLETRARRIWGNFKKSEEKSHQLLLCEKAGGGELCRMLFKGHLTT